jgi:hypothetical protein
VDHAQCRVLFWVYTFPRIHDKTDFHKALLFFGAKFI